MEELHSSDVANHLPHYW